jgi:hypothetical protein
MTITYNKTRAVFGPVVGYEEAEPLLEWLQKYPRGKVDLGACTHLHPALLQVLMAARCIPSVKPQDATLATWIASALEPA